MRSYSAARSADMNFKTGNFFSRGIVSEEQSSITRRRRQKGALLYVLLLKASGEFVFFPPLSRSLSLFFGNWLQKKAGCEPSSLNEKHVAGIQNSGVFQHGPGRHLFLVCTAESWSSERGAGVERRWSGGGGGGRGGVVSKGRLLRGSEGSRGRAIAFLPPSAIEHRSLPIVYIRYESATAVKHAWGVGGWGGIFLSTLVPICPEQTFSSLSV